MTGGEALFGFNLDQLLDMVGSFIGVFRVPIGIYAAMWVGKEFLGMAKSMFADAHSKNRWHRTRKNWLYGQRRRNISDDDY